MATYRYYSPGSLLQTVRAASVEFQPTHVVFRDLDGRVLLAEEATCVRRLTNVDAEGAADRRPPLPEGTP